MSELDNRINKIEFYKENKTLLELRLKNHNNILVVGYVKDCFALGQTDIEINGNMEKFAEPDSYAIVLESDGKSIWLLREDIDEESILPVDSYKQLTIRNDEPISEEIRNFVLDRDSKCILHLDNKCFGLAETIDHIIPRELGGSNHPSNLIASCKHCNSKKGERLLI